jgi:hypothetical protein
MNSYTLILIIGAKSIFGGLAPLGWGLTLNAIMQEKATNRPVHADAPVR